MKFAKPGALIAVALIAGLQPVLTALIATGFLGERLRALQAEQSGLEAELESLYREWESLSESLAEP